MSNQTPWLPRAFLLVLGGLLGSGLLALFFFDPSQYHFYPVCFFHQATGLLCPGCGSLRAIHQLLHGHLAAAFRYNPLLIASVPAGLSLAGAHWLRRKREQPMFSSTALVWVWVVPFVVLGIAFSLWRNFSGSPMAMLPP